MSKFNNDSFIGLISFAAGMFGIGYGICMRSKVSQISEKLDKSVDELTNDLPIDISEFVIRRAVEKAVEKQVNSTVHKTIEQDIHKQVGDIVESEYSKIKNTVLAEVTNEAAKIDVQRVRSDVEKAAKDHALKNFDANLNDILEDYKSNLESVTKIYKSFADIAAPSREKETILKIV